MQLPGRARAGGITMTTRLRKLGIRATARRAVAATPVAAACSSGPSYDDWAATDGAAGRINLDEVQTSFKGAKSVSDFENRVNQIYEGDGLVLIRAEQTDTALVLEGWEDLNGNSKYRRRAGRKALHHHREGRQEPRYARASRQLVLPLDVGAGKFSLHLPARIILRRSQIPICHQPRLCQGDVKRESLVLSECIRV